MPWAARGETVYEGEMMEWEKLGEDDYELFLSESGHIAVYRFANQLKWRWLLATDEGDEEGTGDTELEAKSAAIKAARDIFTPKLTELTSIMEILNAAATLEPTP